MPLLPPPPVPRSLRRAKTPPALETPSRALGRDGLAERGPLGLDIGFLTSGTVEDASKKLAEMICSV